MSSSVSRRGPDRTTSKRSAWTLRVALSCALSGAAPALSALASTKSVVVVDVEENGAAESAGLRVGDVLAAWSAPHRGDVRLRIDSPFDLLEAEMEGAAGPVTLHGSRGGREQTWTVPPGAWSWFLGSNHWGVEARPRLPAASRRLLEDGLELLRAQRHEIAAGRFCQAADTARAAGDPRAVAWLQFRAARALAGVSWSEADALYVESMRDLPPRARTQVLFESGFRLWKAPPSDPLRARSRLEEALLLVEREDPEGIGAARALAGLGICARLQVNTTEWEHLHRLSMSIRERLAPASLAVAENLIHLATVRVNVGDVDLGETLARRAVALLERLDPDAQLMLYALWALGQAQSDRADYAAAEKAFRRLVEMADRVRIHGGVPTASAQPSVWAALNSLGIACTHRGDFAEAESYFRRALEVAEKRTRIPRNVIVTLLNLSEPARQLGRPDEAEARLVQALQIMGGREPGAYHALAFGELGAIRRAAGDITAAEALQRESIAVNRRILPGTLLEADSHLELGLTLLAGGEPLRAEQALLDAHRIREAKAPGSAKEAESLYQLGIARRRMGDRGGAADLLCQAVEALESQRGRLGGGQGTRAALASRFADLYHDYVEVLIELGRPEEAFRVLEGSRARAFLSMLAERDLAFASDAPPELAAEPRRIARAYDRVLASLEKADGAGREPLLAELRSLRGEADAVIQRIRESSPRLASLRYPVPLGVTEARAALDDGTALLSYSVGKDRTFLFLLMPDRPLSVFRIERTRQDLSGRIDLLRRLIDRGRSDPELSTTLLAEAVSLFDDLVAPAAPLLESATRLLICADGPLHTLPFAALARRDAPAPLGRAAGSRPQGGIHAPEPRYLALWKPLHSVLSATVYGEQRKARRVEGRPLELAAFGDPRYPTLTAANAGSIADEALSAVVRGGFTFQPLPASRQEVESIAALFGDGARSFVGEEATEERAKGIARDVRCLHFACHGLLNERTPLDSALVLSIPESPGEGRDNGLLQAWEILESVRTDADLVTLSACETALGTAAGGEGLLGLTRAFQHAGARSVLASLWNVGDESTAELMRRFYGHLRAGLSKDEALRAAQGELIRSPRPSLAHPFAWAGFHLAGDYR